MYYAFNTSQIKIIQNSLFTGLLRTTNLTHSCYWHMWINSAYELLIWRSRIWKSELDIQRRWLCFIVISCNDVRHYVISCFQWLSQLLFSIHNNLNSSNFCCYIWKFLILRRTKSDMLKNVYYTTCKLVGIIVIF
jgi:hypothetical protein